MKKTLVIAVVLLVAAGASWAAYDQLAPVPKGKRVIESMLLDPNSVEFKNVRSAAGAVCGQVNAKNKFGGYTGFKEFIVIDDEAYIAWTLTPDPSPIQSERQLDGLSSTERKALLDKHDEYIANLQVQLKWLERLHERCLVEP